MFLALVTIGIGELTHQAIINLPDLTGSFTGVRAIPMPRIGGYVFNASSYYYIVLAVVVLSLLVKQRIVDSRIGRAFIAIRENSDAANAMGINVTYYKVVAFACSAAFTGIVGLKLDGATVPSPVQNVLNGEAKGTTADRIPTWT